MNFNFPSKLDPAKCVLAKWELQNESLSNMINIRQTIYCFSPPQNMAQKFNHWSFLCLKIFIAEPSHQPWEVIFNIFFKFIHCYLSCSVHCQILPLTFSLHSINFAAIKKHDECLIKNILQIFIWRKRSLTFSHS